MLENEKIEAENERKLINKTTSEESNDMTDD
jgi:hypothetical protein